MTRSKSKWFLIGLIPICVSCTTFHAEIMIPAEPETIWSVLIDAPGYKEWNPLLTPITGSLQEGQKITYQMTQPDGKQSELTSKIKKMIAYEELNQCGGIPGILTFNHKYLLEPVEGGTKVTQHEVDRGIGLLFWDYSWVQPTYEKVNQALKDRVLVLLQKNVQQ